MCFYSRQIHLLLHSCSSWIKNSPRRKFLEKKENNSCNTTIKKDSFILNTPDITEKRSRQQEQTCPILVPSAICMIDGRWQYRGIMKKRLICRKSRNSLESWVTYQLFDSKSFQIMLMTICIKMIKYMEQVSEDVSLVSTKILMKRIPFLYENCFLMSFLKKHAFYVFCRRSHRSGGGIPQSVG